MKQTIKMICVLALALGCEPVEDEQGGSGGSAGASAALGGAGGAYGGAGGQEAASGGAEGYWEPVEPVEGKKERECDSRASGGCGLRRNEKGGER